MASKILSVRDEIVAIITSASPVGTPNEGTLPMAVRIRPSMLALMEFGDVPMDQPPLVTVVSRGRNKQSVSRTGTEDEIETSIAVQRQVRLNDRGEPADDLARIDFENLLAIAEQIADLFDREENYRLPITRAAFDRTEHRPIWIQEHLYEHNLFTSVINVFYKL